MTNAPGFYRRDPDSGEILFGTTLDTPSGHYDASLHANYTYPIDGAWYYYTDSDLASTALSDTVPSTVSAMQACITLARIPSPTQARKSFYQSIEAWVATQDTLTQIAWDKASVFERKSPLVNTVLGTVFGQTDSQIDEFFKQAALVSV